MAELWHSTDTLPLPANTIERFRVRVIHGPDIGHQPVSAGIELTIGVARDNDLRLGDPSVSRHHCCLRVTRSGVQLRDLGSTNGTKLGDYRVNTALISHGAIIGIGKSLLVFESADNKLSEPPPQAPCFGPLIGQSDAMRRLFAVASRIAPSNATVLLEGETGTGKELFASALHEASLRANQPFVVIDCGALPATLIESELFGHEKGAFTGAYTARTGLFEAAAGGTVFLDEIGELPKELQPRLLRVLERREVRRIGSETRRAVDIRVIAATNRDLRRAVDEGCFRSDLWYRLNTFRLKIPPLRQRRNDIPLLVQHFYAQLTNDPTACPPSSLLIAMQRGDWPGNVRELRSAVERSLIFDNPETWCHADPSLSLPRGDDPPPLPVPFRAAKLDATRTWERDYLEKLVRHNDHNLSRSARAASMDRGYLRELLRRHEIRAGSDKQ